MFSGETSFRPTDEIAAQQEWEFAEAFIAGQSPPSLSVDVDEVLESKRNVWLPVFHITVKSDFSMFASGLRKSRSSAKESLTQLAVGWAKNRPTFDQILKHELSSYGSAMREALRAQIARNREAFASDDPSSVLDMSFGLISRYEQLARMFERNGVSKQDAAKQVSKFLDWQGNQEQPAHKISAYLSRCPRLAHFIRAEFNARREHLERLRGYRDLRAIRRCDGCR